MMNNRTENRISISAEFLKAFAEIPPSQQKKVREFVQQFQNNPDLPGGCHYEQLQKACDPALRSIRIDQNYRAIVAKPAGNVFILLWVDTHDSAYHWAERKKLRIHPNTGGIQLIQIQQPQEAEKKQKPVFHSLFEAFSDPQLLSLGIPEEMLSQTRTIQTEDELFLQELNFPQEAYNSLFLLACGETYESVSREYNRVIEATVDTTDFWSALDNNDTQSRFTVVANSIELESLLNAPLEQWRVFLHPLQRKMVEMDASGPARILGGAGTGKTVVAIHRAKYLLQNVFPDKNDRILFTTFSKSLAADIFASLQQICPPELLRQIEVINLDAWTKNYLDAKNFRCQVIDYDEKRKNELWERALTLKPASCSLSDQFFKDEWEQIIQPQSIFTVDDYFKASRTGRGRRLNRLERKALWPVWEEYRALLNEENWREIQDLYRDATVLMNKNNDTRYRAVIVDEGQDFSLQAYTMIRAMLPAARNDIFIVGDAHQRIYGRKTALSKSGIQITGRSRKLKVNYRTTEQTYRFASSILTGLSFDDLDGQEDALGKCQSVTSGPVPDLKLFTNFDEERKQIIALLEKLQNKGIAPASVCIACRTNDLVNRYSVFFEENTIPCCKITSSTVPDSRKKGVRLATMHRVKGIEFDYMILVSVCDGIMPPSAMLAAQENETDRQAVLQRERSLLYVALTRARKAVFITAYGKLSALLEKPVL
ncbi:MAG: 3'-5' exonuclease [Lentisphaeria bacterium]